MNGLIGEETRDLGADERTWGHLLISLALQKHPDARCLVLCSSIPDWVIGHGGKLTVIAREMPTQAYQSRDLRFLKVSDTDGLVAALAREAPGPGKPAYDLIFVDFYHELGSLRRQLEALRPFGDDTTLYLFDDAVPPSLSMTGPEPKAGQWWVGEVWMLAGLLRPIGADGFVHTAAVRPTGLLAARGFAIPEAPVWEARRTELAAIDSEAALNASFAHLSDEAFGRLLASTLDECGASGAKPIVPASPLANASTVEQLDLERSWAKPKPAFLLNLSSQQLDFSFVDRGPRVTHGTYLCDYEDVDLIGFRALLKGDRCFIRYDQGIEGYLDRVASNIGNYSNEATGIRRLRDGYVVARDLSNPTVVDAPVLFATPDEPDNWGMWLFQGVRSAIEFQNEPDRYDRLFSAIRSPWQHDLLLATGFDPARLMEQDVNRHYRLRRAGMVAQTRRDLILTENDRHAFDELVDRMLPRASVASHPRLFVSRLSRTRRGSYRGLINEAELMAALEELGFLAVEPETLSLADQIKLFRTSEIVVGLGGAAMFNAAFCKPGTRIVTIESTPTYIDAHTNIFASMGLEYGVILGEEDLTDPRPDHRRWRLDVAAAVHGLKAFL